MEAAGFSPEDYEGDPVELYPENWDVWKLYASVSTQWRTTMSGPIGLDYTVLFRFLDDRFREDKHEWNCAFNDIREMELAALEKMREKS